MTERRSLAIFVAGASTSNAGSFMQATAVPFVVFELTGSNAWVGAAVFAALTCSVLIGPVAGIAIDRFSQKHALVLAQFVQMGAALGLWALSATDALAPWPMLGLVALGGLGSGFQYPAAQSFVPLIVSPPNLARAVRLTTLGLTVSRTVGPALAGIILSARGPGTLFLLNAATFVLYLGALLVLRPRRSHTVETERTWFAQYRATLRHVAARPGLRAVLQVGFAGAVFGTSIAFLVPGIAHLYGAGARGVGALTALYGVGAIAGSSLLVAVGDRLGRGRAARVGLAAFGAGGLLTVATTTFGIGAVAFGVMGIGYSLWLTSIGTALQMELSDAFRGRVTTLYIAAVVGGTPVGAVIGGAIGDVVGLRPTLAVYALVLTGLAAAGGAVLGFRLLDGPNATEIAPVPASDWGGAS